MAFQEQPPIPDSPFRSRPLPSLSSAVKQTVDPSFTLSNGDKLLKHGGKTISKSNNVLHEQAQESGEQSRKKPLGPSTSYDISRTPATRKTTGKGKVDRLRMLQNESKKAESVPTLRKPDNLADVTGMTSLMATPAKGLIFDSLENNGDVGGMSAGKL